MVPTSMHGTENHNDIHVNEHKWAHADDPSFHCYILTLVIAYAAGHTVYNVFFTILHTSFHFDSEILQLMNPPNRDIKYHKTKICNCFHFGHHAMRNIDIANNDDKFRKGSTTVANQLNDM